MKHLLFFIRRYNPFLRSVIGWCVGFLCTAIVAYVFAIGFTDVPKPQLVLLCVFCGVFTLTLTNILGRIAHFSSAYELRVEHLFKIVPHLGVHPYVKHR